MRLQCSGERLFLAESWKSFSRTYVIRKRAADKIAEDLACEPPEELSREFAELAAVSEFRDLSLNILTSGLE